MTTALAIAAAVAALGLVTRRPPARGRSVTSRPRWATLPTPRPVVEALHRSAVPLDATRAFSMWVAAVVLSVVATPVVPGGPMTTLAVAAGPPVALAATRHRREVLRRRHLPEVLDGVASALRSGRSVRSAVSDVAPSAGPLGDELRRISARAERGHRLTDVLADWGRTEDPDSRLAGAALATAADLGGPAAAALETTAQSLRDRAAADGVVDALSVQARLSALVLTVAPLGFAALMTGIDPMAARFLFHTPVGWLCLAVGLALDLAGAAWMRRLVRRAR